MSKKAKIILCAALVLLIAVFCAARLVLAPEPVTGDKHIIFEATGHENTKSFEINTDAETLADALMQEKLIDAEEGPYGLWVTAIFGETADGTQNEYWMFYKDGIELATGISETYIADGEHYEARIVRY